MKQSPSVIQLRWLSPVPPQLLRHSPSERLCDHEQSLGRKASSAASGPRCCRLDVCLRPELVPGGRKHPSAEILSLLCSVTLLCHRVESGEWRVFCCAHTLSSSWFYPPLSEKSPLLSAGPSCLICRSPFSLSLIVIFTISFYLSDRVFIFSLSLRIFFIPKSHFLHSARQTCSSRDVLYNDVSMSDSRAESYIL